MGKKIHILLTFTAVTLTLCYGSQCPKPSVEQVIQAKAQLRDPLKADKTCSMTQICKRSDGDPTMQEGRCPNGADPLHILNPTIGDAEPRVLYRQDSKTNFKLICPFMDPEQPICCNDDQVEIMIKGTGYQMDPDDGNLTLTNFTVDPDYACTMFQSCAKVSIVAAASLQSSEAFLDFLGFNGKQQGKSIIKFLFSKDHTASLVDNIHSCDEAVPGDNVFDQYANCKNCTCAYCDSACKPPEVNADIGFFDGFNGELVGISYGVLIAFSIIFQLLRCYCAKKQKVNESMEEDSADADEQTKDKIGVNAGYESSTPKQKLISNKFE
ncbi:UNKNOWN [Stylonychia lemnae]|uniref:Niemann-Pick C1 N-terminal domain-containing protein n=1 Tax=Stylonychia lemnae TaxID=5949 RepID=A0A078AAZ4_STYLE|nr:UNKNOWN [Stylonychia lemnae]|eukprot:CDW79430.1 UNKNOWN [Stylonychia lemnae]